MLVFSNDVQTSLEFKFCFPIVTLSVSVMWFDEESSRHSPCNYDPLV